MRSIPGPDEFLRSLLVANGDQEYQREVQSTSTGRRSFELRRRAALLHGAGRQEEAHQLLLDAVRLHPETDHGVAAGSARNDLGHSFSCRRLGVRVENLLAAERYFKSALTCPSRSRGSFHGVQTENSLGPCLRRLASECQDEGGGARYLDEAEDVLRGAASAAEALGPVAWSLAAGYHVNVGNLLLEQRKDPDAALLVFRHARELGRRAVGVLPESASADVPLQAALAAATAHLRRGRRGDAQSALDLAEEVLHPGDPRFDDAAHLVAADAWMRIKDGRSKEEALRHLRTIDFDRLDPRKAEQAAELFRRLKRIEVALSLIERTIARNIAERSRAVADHVAAEAALQANRLAAVAARLYVEKGDPLGAFLVLENCSGLNFIEVASTYTWQPADPVTRGLLREYRRLSEEAVQFDQLASVLDRTAKEAWRNLLGELSDRVGEAGSGRSDVGDLRRILKTCATDQDPPSLLRSEAHRLAASAERVHDVLCARDPEARPALEALEYVLDRKGLGSLLAEHPGHLFVRLSLARDLLAVAVWQEDGKLVPRAHRLPVPADLWRLLDRASRRTPGSSTAAVTSAFERLDLSPVLPAGNLARAVVLPSFGAAFLPLAALGPRGKRLLDRFESIIWLPSTYPLRTRQDAYPPRRGVLAALPGGTRLHAGTFGDAEAAEQVLRGAEATRSRVIERVALVDVARFYTHGRHDTVGGPSVDLADGAVGAADLSGRCEGMERVELWACETGVGMPSDPLTPPGVDEPFGLDFDLLRLGVRSAIGTLWAVPEVVTAAMVRRYRQGVANGSDPACALADAQRWWLSEGLPSLAEHLGGRAQEGAVAAFVSSIGSGPGCVDPAMLGPAAGADKPMSQVEVERWVEWLACPASWAGFRFVGVPNRRPRRRWTDEHRQLIDEHVMSEVRRLVESGAAARDPDAGRRDREEEE